MGIITGVSDGLYSGTHLCRARHAETSVTMSGPALSCNLPKSQNNTSWATFCHVLFALVSSPKQPRFIEATSFYTEPHFKLSVV